MAPALDVDVVRSSVLAVVVALVSDRIPNIRFNVAKALEVLAQSLATQSGGKELIQEGILPNLQKLKGDNDPDVRFFAEKAIITAEEVLGSVSGISNDDNGLNEVVMTDA